MSANGLYGHSAWYYTGKKYKFTENADDCENNIYDLLVKGWISVLLIFIENLTITLMLTC